MRKKFLIFLSICIIACLSLCLASCVDNTDYSGEVRVTINLDKEYPEVSVNCPQGEIEKKDNKQYVVSLSNTLPVDIVVACPGYETVIFSFTTKQLKQNSDITESVTFKNEFYRFSFKVQNNEKIEFAEDYEGINLSIQSGSYVLESEKPITQDIKFNVKNEEFKPFVIFEESIIYNGAKGSLVESIPLLDKRESNSAVIYVPTSFGHNKQELAMVDAKDFDMDYEKVTILKAGEYKKVEIKNYVLFDRYNYYYGSKTLVTEDTLKNNDYCNLATCETIESDANQKTSVDFELKDKLTGTILQNISQDICQGEIVYLSNFNYSSDYSIVGAEEVVYYEEIFGNKIVVELMRQYVVTLHITNYQDIQYEEEYQSFNCGSGSDSLGFNVKQMIENNGRVEIIIKGNMAGKKLQFVMTSFMNNEPKYVFILSIPENMENMNTFETIVEAADAGW